MSAWAEIVNRDGSDEWLELCSRALTEVQAETSRRDAERIRRHADDPRVKPHLLEGEWTGLRMGANVIDSKREA